MQTLLNLPLEILGLVVEYLMIKDLLNLCASCQVLRRIFRPERFIWLMKNAEGDSEDRDKAVIECSHVMRCHALSELFRFHGLDYNYTIFFDYGASFKPIRHRHVLLSLFDLYKSATPGAELDFLLDHGASLNSISGGANRLLENAILEHGPCEMTDTLFQHGATLRGVPRGPEMLMDGLLGRSGQWDEVEFLLKNGGPLRYTTESLKQELIRQYKFEDRSDYVECLVRNVPHALNILIENTLVGSGFEHDVNRLLRVGCSFRQVTSKSAAEGGYGFLSRALLTLGVDLTMTDQHGWTPLYRATVLGYTEIVKALLKKGAPLNEETADRRTALHAAASRGDHEIIMILLDAGADPTIRCNPTGSTPLHSAASARHVEATKVLAQWPHLNVADKMGRSALFVAADKGSTAVVKVLLDAGADPYFRVNGLLPIHKAATAGHAETVTSFVHRGVHPGTTTLAAKDGGKTPLHLAASSGRLGVVKAMIAHGSSPTATTDDGRTALDMAAAGGHLNVVRCLRRSNVERPTGARNRKTPLDWACQNGQLDVVKMLVKTHECPAMKDKSMLVAMMRAAVNGHGDVVQFLIHQGVHPDPTYRAGRNILWYAAAYGQGGLLRFLINQSARVDPETVDGIRPLYIAALRGHPDAVKILAESQADTNARARNGKAALHVACEIGNIEVVKVLVEHQADINAKIRDGVVPHRGGVIPLHKATQIGSVEIMRYLLQHKADVNKKMMAGKTSLHIAAADGRLKEDGRLKAVQVLIEHNADLNARDDTGCSPLSCASRTGELGVVKLLVKASPYTAANLSSTPHLDYFHRTPLHWAVYRRHLHVAKFLVESGINTKTLDCYGRTALDWASMDRDLFHDLLDPGYQLTPENTRLKIVRQSMIDLSIHLLKGFQKDASAGLLDLGHCLVFLGDVISAPFIFQQHLAAMCVIFGLQQHLAAMKQIDKLVPQSTCYNATCGNKSEAGTPDPRHYVCSTCPDFILCATCLKADTREQFTWCRDHVFIEIPQPTEKHCESWRIAGVAPPYLLQWLEDLVDRYGGTVPDTSDEDSDA